MSELPRTWAAAPLGELIPPNGVFTDGDWVESKDQDPCGEVRLIQLADVADSRFVDKSSRFLTRAKANELNCTFLKEGDLLVARMPDPLGRCCIFPLDGEERFVTVVDVCAIRLGSAEIDPRYLMRALNSPLVRDRVTALQSGSTRKRISRRNLATVSIPIPPLNEQNRIVERIDILFDEIDRGVASLRDAKRAIELYRQSLLKSAFEGRLTAGWRADNADKAASSAVLLTRVKEQHHGYKATPGDYGGVPSEWLCLSLSSLGRVAGGLTKSQKRNDLPLKAKYLRVANVYANHLQLDEIKAMGVTEDELRKTRLEDGDLLFVEGNGSTKQIGRVAIWDDSIPNVIHQNHLIRFRSNGLLSPRFALYFMMSPVGRRRITAQASSTSGLHTLSISKVGALPTPLCSPAEQTEIVRLLDARLEAAEALEREIGATLVRAEALRQSVLKQAFSGKLVPQDPTDEPATALLARIRADHDTDATKDQGGMHNQ